MMDLGKRKTGKQGKKMEKKGKLGEIECDDFEGSLIRHTSLRLCIDCKKQFMQGLCL